MVCITIELVWGECMFRGEIRSLEGSEERFRSDFEI